MWGGVEARKWGVWGGAGAPPKHCKCIYSWFPHEREAKWRSRRVSVNEGRGEAIASQFSFASEAVLGGSRPQVAAAGVSEFNVVGPLLTQHRFLDDPDLC